MGDLFVFTSMEARSMSFSCFHTLSVTQHMFCPKSFGISSIPKPRFRNSNNKLPKSISCSNNDAASGDFDIVSASTCSDGSVLFRFGNLSEFELARNIEVEEDARIANVTKVEIPEKESIDILNEPFETPDRATDSQVAEAHGDISGSVLEFDLQTNVHCEEDSNEKAYGEIVNRVTVSERDSEFGGNHEGNGKSKVITVPLDSKMDLVSDGEIVCASLEVLQDSAADEVTTQFPSSRSGVKDELPNIYASQESGETSQNIEVKQISTTATEEKVDMVPNYVTVEVIPKSTPWRDDTVLDDETTRVAVDEAVDPHSIVISKIEEEITKDAPLSGNTTEVSVFNSVELQSVGPTIERKEMPTTELCLCSGVALLRHPSKALTGWGDAYFVAFQNWLGIADGIGQWSIEGANSGIYAQELMENCEKIVLESESVPITDPIAALNRSAVKTQSPGSSTVLVAYFDHQALHVANIGDSGFIVIRHGTVFKRSSPMVHEFNFPIRIERGDDPSDLVEVYKIDLNEGDVIVTGTDGLFDNLSDQEIVSIVSTSLQDGFKPEEIAQSLAMRAQEVGRSDSVRSPFADAAHAAGYVGYRGGKPDDVTVIISLVEKRPSAHIE